MYILYVLLLWKISKLNLLVNFKTKTKSEEKNIWTFPLIVETNYTTAQCFS